MCNECRLALPKLELELEFELGLALALVVDIDVDKLAACALAFLCGSTSSVNVMLRDFDPRLKPHDDRRSVFDVLLLAWSVPLVDNDSSYSARRNINTTSLKCPC